MTTIDDIIENFSLLDDWEDRYRYVIELGKMLEPLPDELKNDQNKVSGCASQVWLATTISDATGAEPALMIRGDSDAHIVRGLVAILLALCSGKTGAEILKADPVALFERLGLREHLTPQRSNGFKSMVGRIHAEARELLAASSAAT
ncbi:SufE family protein [Methylocystis suflitae]|uniref:SufE family protein n=1 Tax=Methylocystis suflitae TaxID=2951405 RepID=UPI00210C89C6|nr:SufE family protein [Methylocystis suflitae]MCQ4191637.1 SufE family protein [Methylocystis suflitae]